MHGKRERDDGGVRNGREDEVHLVLTKRAHWEGARSTCAVTVNFALPPIGDSLMVRDIKEEEER